MSKKQTQKQDVGIWTVSNGLSFLRLLLAIPLILLFSNPYGNKLVILGICFIAYVTDLADGWLARMRNETSDFGRMLDPLSDKVVVLTIMVAMLVTNLLPEWFIAIVVGRDIIIFVAGIYLKKKTGILVESNMTGKAAVVSIMIVIVLAMFQQDMSRAALQGFMILSVGLLAASMYQYGERYFRLMRKHSK
jgi:cardiolipin synthase (CMP-forming)